MPTATYIALANTTLSSTATSITFSSIPATYRDLVLVIAGTTDAARTIGYRLNSDTGSNYSYVYMQGNGSATESGNGTLTLGLLTRMGTGQSTTIAHFMDYSATDKHKTVLSRGGTSAELLRAHASRWASTNAVTSIYIATLDINANAFQIGTTFALYGIVS
jgi:hypothetical protein